MFGVGEALAGAIAVLVSIGMLVMPVIQGLLVAGGLLEMLVLLVAREGSVVVCAL